MDEIATLKEWAEKHGLYYEKFDAETRINTVGALSTKDKFCSPRIYFKWEGESHCVVLYAEGIARVSWNEYPNGLFYYKKIDELFAKVGREFWKGMYYGDCFWGHRFVAMSEADAVNDINRLWEIAREQLDELRKWKEKSCKGDKIEDDSCQVVTIKTITLNKLLEEKTLIIPKYQRGYCWQKENIAKMFADIKDTANAKSVIHLGALVLSKSSENKDIFEIIDGQQRITTLTMFVWLKLWLKEKSEDKIQKSLLGQKVSGDNLKCNSRKALADAKAQIEKFDFTPEDVKMLLDKICFSVVTVIPQRTEDEYLKYAFFGNLNGKGKMLSDYDLIKAYHLYCVKGGDLIEGKMSTQWHNLEKERGVLFNGNEKLNILQELMHCILFRLRMWDRCEYFNWLADDRRWGQRALYNHFSEGANDAALLTGTNRIPFQLNSTLSGGLEFFQYLSNCHRIYSMFVTHNIIRSLRGWQNPYLGSAIIAVAFMFYEKFGDLYLEDAVCAIAYRISRVRADCDSIKRATLPQSSIVRDIVGKINRATNEGEFLAWAVKDAYRVNTAEWGQAKYWSPFISFIADWSKKCIAITIKHNDVDKTVCFNATLNQNRNA